MRSIISTLVVSLVLSICATDQMAQGDRLIIKPKKVTYTRKGSNIDDWKRTFYVRYPIIVSGSSASARKNILKEIDYWHVFEISRDENLSGDDQSLVSFDYKTLYNAHNIYDIAITAETVGAYPSSYTKYFVFDVRTGSQLTFSDVFKESSLPSLLSKIRQAMKRELATHPSAR